MSDSPRLTKHDLVRVQEALISLSDTLDHTELTAQRAALKELWAATFQLVGQAPATPKETTSGEALVEAASADLEAQIAVSDAIAAALDLGGGKVVTAAKDVEGASHHVLQIGRVILSACGMGAQGIINALGELATTIRDGDVS